jgi:ribonucleoside-diphosphate reductase alpha chain
VIKGGDKTLDESYAQGFFAGDGTTTDRHDFIDLYHNKRNLINEFPNADWISINTSLKRIRFRYDNLLTKDFVPNASYNLSTRLEWLAGLCDADGAVNNGQIQITSIDRQFMYSTMLMLQTLGVNSKLKIAHMEGDRLLPDGKGGKKMYPTQTCYRILITRAGVNQLLDIGFRPRRLKISHQIINRTAERRVVVTSVVRTDRKDDTYCFNEPERHMGMFNGILTGQCSEIMLPSNDDWSFVCCLSSLNLRHYDEWKDTDLVETMIAFLDAVMSEFISKIEAFQNSEDSEKRLAGIFMARALNFAKANRALGLGVLGWHSLLQEKQLGFEGVEATTLTEEIFSLIKERADMASIDLALEFGEPEVLKGYGRRNTTLLAIAPTTSSAFILGQVSQGIEPIWSNCYVKDVAKLKVTIKNPQLEQLLETKGLNTKEVWDSIRDHDGSVQHLEALTDHERVVFRTFAEIDQSELLAQAAVRQRYIDQGQSLNIMIDPSLGIKELNALHIQAWKNGIKSLYYQHSMNAAQQMVRRKLNEK